MRRWSCLPFLVLTLACHPPIDDALESTAGATASVVDDSRLPPRALPIDLREQAKLCADFAADEVHRGSVVVRELDDLLRLGSIACVAGNLTVFATQLSKLRSLQELQVVDGNLKVVGNSELRTFRLPLLRRVGGLLKIDRNPQLEHFEMASLDTVQGDLIISHDPSLTAFALPALQEVGCCLDIHDNEHLHRCDITALVEQLRRRRGIADLVNVVGNLHPCRQVHCARGNCHADCDDERGYFCK